MSEKFPKPEKDSPSEPSWVPEMEIPNPDAGPEVPNTDPRRVAPKKDDDDKPADPQKKQVTEVD